MDALTLLTTRHSNPKLCAPAPNAQQLLVIQQAALRVPDHGNLKPFQFIVFQQEGLTRLSTILADAQTRAGATEADIEKARNMPFRAPMVIVCVANITAHDKVPAIEQIQAAGCAVMAMQQAAFAQGLAGIWRTGPLASNKDVKASLKLASTDEIVGFLYIGTPEVEMKLRPLPELDRFFTQG